MPFPDHDDLHPEGPHTAVRRRGRPNVEKRRGAEELLRRVVWLERQLVHWEGDTTVERDGSVTARLVERLAREPPGLYSVHCHFDRENQDQSTKDLPQYVTEVTRVDSTLLAQTAAAFTASHRFPRIMGKLLDDPNAWRTRGLARLGRASRALQDVQAYATGAKVGARHTPRQGCPAFVDLIEPAVTEVKLARQNARPTAPGVTAAHAAAVSHAIAEYRLISSELPSAPIVKEFSDLAWFIASVGAGETVYRVYRDLRPILVYYIHYPVVVVPPYDNYHPMVPNVRRLLHLLDDLVPTRDLWGYALRTFARVCAAAPGPQARQDARNWVEAVVRATQGERAASVSAELDDARAVHEYFDREIELTRRFVRSTEVLTALDEGLDSMTTAVHAIAREDATLAATQGLFYAVQALDRGLRWNRADPASMTTLLQTMESALEALPPDCGWRLAAGAGELLDAVCGWLIDLGPLLSRPEVASVTHRIVEVALLTRMAATGHHFSPKTVWTALDNRTWVVAIYLEWIRAGYSQPDRLLDAALDATRRWEDQALLRADEYASGWPGLCLPGYWKEFLVALSVGSINTLVSLLPRAACETGDLPVEGLRGISREAAALEFLSRWMQVPAHWTRGLALLRTIEYATRLPTRQAMFEDLARWSAAADDDSAPDSGNAAPEPVAGLAAVRRYRSLAGSADHLSASLRKILERRQRLEEELQTLEAQREVGPLPARAALRCEHLRTLLADPAGIAAWVQRDAERQVTKELEAARIEALEAIAHRAVRSYRQSVFGDLPIDDADNRWSNALSMYANTRHNRRLLRALITHEARNAHNWAACHPGNVAFVQRLLARGMSSQDWFAPRELALGEGTRRVVAYVECDRLRKLQMGTIFGTCLGAEGYNSHAAIANAIETNKHVLYVRDHRGTIVGRKLVVLDESTRFLWGFESYGAAMEAGDRRSQPWIKIALDILCRRLADATGARLRRSTSAFFGKDGPGPMALFAKVYYGYPERFDWWMHALPAIERRCQCGEAGSLVARLLRRLGLQRGKERRDMDLRLLLWLDATVPEAVKAVHDRLAPDVQAFLARHRMPAPPSY